MKRIFAVARVLVGVCPLLAADPYAGYIYPSGIQIGTTNRFIIGGQNLWGLQGVHFSATGLHVLKVERVPSFTPPTNLQRRHLKNWLDGLAEGRIEEPPKPNDPHLDEWRSNVWWCALNTLDAGQWAIVEHYLYTPRNTLQESPSLRQMALVTVAADASLQPGWCSFSVWNANGMSAPRPFGITALPRAAEPLYVPPHRAQPPPTFADIRVGGIVLDGQILPGATDTFRLRLAAGRPYTFQVMARELQPYIGDAVPGFFNAILTLKDEDGNVLATADDASRFRPDPAFAFTPEREGDYLLEIHDVLYRGRSDFVYEITIGTEPSRPDVPGGMRPSYPSPDGVVSQAGGVSSKTFTIDSPGPHILEVTARRKGSPLDAVLTLRRKADGPVLAQWDDVTNTVFTGTIPQGECDPIGVYDFQEPGKYVAEITDRTGHGGTDYVWWLEVRRPAPGFEVYATRSTLPVRAGVPLKVEFRILRKDGFTGDVTIEFPEGIRAKNSVVTSGVDRVTAELFCDRRRPAEIKPVSLSARATINGKTVRRPVIPCDEYEQAFAWRHLVPAQTFLFRGPSGGAPSRDKRQSGKKQGGRKAR